MIDVEATDAVQEEEVVRRLQDEIVANLKTAEALPRRGARAVGPELDSVPGVDDGVVVPDRRIGEFVGDQADPGQPIAPRDDGIAAEPLLYLHRAARPADVVVLREIVMAERVAAEIDLVGAVRAAVAVRDVVAHDDVVRGPVAAADL